MRSNIRLATGTALLAASLATGAAALAEAAEKHASETHASEKPTQVAAQDATQAIAVEGPGFHGFEPPAGWLPPPIHPGGVQLRTQEIGQGVYALLSDKPPVDNSGFIVGAERVLVIDAHINGPMARQIIDAVRAVTNKPIAYLVNTNAHGDHTFGNYVFPESTTIVAQRNAAATMAEHFEEEKGLMLAALGGDASVIADVELRLPDVTFEERMTIDLGGRVVELYHFGRGNTTGDTVVYEPETKTAWTGNLILGPYTVPWAIEGDTRAYLRTLARMATELEIETIIPGHVLTTTGAELQTYLQYLAQHIHAVKTAVREGKTLEQTLAALPLEERYLPPLGSPLAAARPVIQGFHLWNVKKTYLELTAQAAGH